MVLKKRFLSFVLCTAMAMALCAPVSAASTKAYASYPYYMCVGDSIAAGCALMKDGSPTPVETATNQALAAEISNGLAYRGFDFATVPNAYHSLVGNALGANILMDARSGTRAVEFRYMLDGIYNDFDSDYSWGNRYVDGDNNGFTLSDVDKIAKDGDYLADYKKADLITLNLGSNDIFSASLLYTMRDSGMDLGSLQGTAQEEDSNQSDDDDITSAFGKLLESAQTVGQLCGIISSALSNLYKCFEQFKVNYPALLNEIYKLNPDVTIVAVGVYNPLENISLSEDLQLIDLSLAADSLTDQINAFLAGLATSYSNYYFADVVGTSTYSANLDDAYFWDYFRILVHPDLEGHQFMAEKILAALPEALEAPTVKASNDINSGKVKLTWNAISGASKYEVYRSTRKGGTYTKMLTTTKTTYTNTSAAAGKSYYYKVKAISDVAGTIDSDFSKPVYRTTDLARPTNFKVTRKNGHPYLTWDAVKGADKYEIYRSKTAAGTYVKIGTTTKCSFTYTSAIAGNKYYFKIKAIDLDKRAASSAFSKYRSVTVK